MASKTKTVKTPPPRVLPAHPRPYEVPGGGAHRVWATVDPPPDARNLEALSMEVHALNCHGGALDRKVELLARSISVALDLTRALTARVAALEAMEHNADGLADDALAEFWDYIYDLSPGDDAVTDQLEDDLLAADLMRFYGHDIIPKNFDMSDPDWLCVLHQMLARTGAVVEDAA